MFFFHFRSENYNMCGQETIVTLLLLELKLMQFVPTVGCRSLITLPFPPEDRDPRSLVISKQTDRYGRGSWVDRATGLFQLFVKTHWEVEDALIHKVPTAGLSRLNYPMGDGEARELNSRADKLADRHIQRQILIRTAALTGRWTTDTDRGSWAWQDQSNSGWRPTEWCRNT